MEGVFTPPFFKPLNYISPMRWNGRNYRPSRVMSKGINPPSPRTKPLNYKDLTWVASFFAGPVGGGETPVPSPTPSPTPTPTPTPSPTPLPACDLTYEFVYEASISPTGATQYENVVLTGSSDMPVVNQYIWTLTDFYNTGDTQVLSYTGNPLTEGYFTSTGSSNVSLSVIGEDINGNPTTATTTDFVVSEFDPSSVPDMLAWIDFSDDSTITYRTGTTYVESITDKTGNWTLSQSTASYQPQIISASTDSSSLLQVASFDGLDNYLLSNALSPQINTFTGMTSFTMATSKEKPYPTEPDNRGLIWSIAQTNPNNGSTTFNNRRALVYSKAQGVIFGTNFYSGFNGDPNHYWSSTASTYPEVFHIRIDNSTKAEAWLNGNREDFVYTATTGGWNVRDFNIGTQGNQDGTSVRNKHFGEYWETLHFSRTLSDNDIDKINRYLQYKWYGTKKY